MKNSALGIHLLGAWCLAACLGIPSSMRAETATFTFAPVGSSFSAFLPADDPLVGKEITSARIYLDVEIFPGSDAANFFTDISFPIEPFPGNENAIVLTGADLGWSGSGTFHYFEETTRFNGTFISTRYGGETPGEGFDGQILDTSRIEFDYVGDGGEELVLESAASRKGHGGTRVFDVNLPLDGEIGIESRAGSGKADIVFTFNNQITSTGAATSTCGKAGHPRVDPVDSHNVLVTLDEMSCNQAVVTVTLTGLTDDQGHTLDSAAVTFGILFGDVNASGAVNNHDVADARAALGERTNRSNFRADVNTDGVISVVDLSDIKGYRGTALP